MLRAWRSTEEVFASTVGGYATLMPEHSNIQLSNGKASYALYPVWILNTTWRDRKYVFAMNGQTGKFVGDLPLDKKAFWRWQAIFTGIFGAAVYGLSWLMYIL